jgi:hypothetical protein
MLIGNRVNAIRNNPYGKKTTWMRKNYWNSIEKLQCFNNISVKFSYSCSIFRKKIDVKSYGTDIISMVCVLDLQLRLWLYYGPSSVHALTLPMLNAKFKRTLLSYFQQILRRRCTTFINTYTLLSHLPYGKRNRGNLITFQSALVGISLFTTSST